MNNSSLFTNVFKSLFGNSITPTSSQFVPITAQDGTPAGVSSMENLASVLGGLPRIGGVSNRSVNTVTEQGKYDTQNNVTDLPNGTSFWGFLYVISVTSSNFGLYIQYWSTNTSYKDQTNPNQISRDIYVRKGIKVNSTGVVTWEDWKVTTVPSYLAGYSDLSSLASALGVSNIVAGHTETGDNQIDAIDENCWFRYNGYTIGQVINNFGIGMCRVDKDNGYRFQILVNFSDSGSLYIRTKVGASATWPSTWNKISITV